MAKCYICLRPLPNCDCNDESKVARLTILLEKCISEIEGRIAGFKTAWQTSPIAQAIEENENLLKEIKQELGIKT